MGADQPDGGSWRQSVATALRRAVACSCARLRSPSTSGPHLVTLLRSAPSGHETRPGLLHDSMLRAPVRGMGTEMMGTETDERHGLMSLLMRPMCTDSVSCQSLASRHRRCTYYPRVPMAVPSCATLTHLYDLWTFKSFLSRATP